MKNWNITFCQQVGKNKMRNHDALFNGQAVFQYKLKKAEMIEIQQESVILGIADGISNSPKPYLASRLVMEELAKVVQLNSTWLRDIRHKLTNRLARDYLGSATTTFVACEIDSNGKCKILNVGDSRAYRISVTGEWQQLSVDHTVLAEMQAQGLVDAHIEYSTLYNGLTDSLVADYESSDFKVFSQEYQLNQGESILLCSDGLSSYLSPTLLSKIWQQYANNKDRLTICRKMVQKHRLYDDFSAVICEFD